MAAPVMRLLACALLLLAASAAAQPLADPTLPPNAPSAAERPTPASALQLQFTRRGPGETMSALLAGRWLRAGESFELNGTTFRVERVTATSVWLARSGERELLEMAPQAAQAVRCRDQKNQGSCQ